MPVGTLTGRLKAKTVRRDRASGTLWPLEPAGMSALAFLVPISIALGGLGLAMFFWAVRAGQFEDVFGAGQRIFLDEDDKPL